jgi:hypothetical protein
MADLHYIARSGSGYQPWANFNGLFDRDRCHQTIATGLAAMTSGRNDVALLSPDSHTQTASLVWNKNMTHLIGAYGPAMMNMRSRIGHSGNFEKLLSITGYGNIFAHLYLMYGAAHADNTVGLHINGNRNTFMHVHVGGPMHATPADEADFYLVSIEEESAGAGNEQYFYKCVFGIDTVAWTNGDMFKHKGTPRLVFEDCIFLMRTDNAQVTILDGTAGDGQGFYLFKNCVGINLGSALTVAFGSTGLASGTDFILHNTGFTGVTDLIGAGDEAKVLITNNTGLVSADEVIGLATAFDHTA